MTTIETVTLSQVRSVLKQHYLTAIHCDHKDSTDRAGCFCSTWYCEPQSSVGAAVDKWVEHVIEQLNQVSQTVRGRQITMRVYFDAAISFIALLGVIFLLAVGFWFYHNWNDIAGIACINGSHEGCREYKPESHTLEGE